MQVFNQFASKQEQEQGQARGMHKKGDGKGLRKAGHHVAEHAVPDEHDQGMVLAIDGVEIGRQDWAVANPIRQQGAMERQLQAHGSSNHTVI
jgi:hypothetical protein